MGKERVNLDIDYDPYGDDMEDDFFISIDDVERGPVTSDSSYLHSNPQIFHLAVVQSVLECLANQLPNRLSERQQQQLTYQLERLARRYYRVAIRPRVLAAIKATEQAIKNLLEE